MPLTFNRYKQRAVRINVERGRPGALLTVDAGAKKAGASLWVWDDVPENARLVAAATLKAPTDAELPEVLYRWTVAVLEGLDARRPTPMAYLWKVVERPQLRKNKRRYHKDLERLLDFILAASQLLGKWDLQLYPEEWKGGVGSTFKSKEPHWLRLRAALTEDELELFDNSGPDGKDAVGIGQFVLGRTGRGGIR